MPKTLLPDNIDAIVKSKEHLLAVVFSKVNSPYYHIALEAAQSAYLCMEWIADGNKKFHLIAFSRDPSNVACAQTVLSYALDWKGTRVYAGGKLLTRTYYARKVINCYAEACNSLDWKAHCFEVIDDPTLNFATQMHMATHGIEIKRYTSPCKLLSLYIDCDQDHPASIHDQIHAIAVERDCAWCPNFDEKNFKSVK